MTLHEKKSTVHMRNSICDCDVVLPYDNATYPYVQTAIDSILLQQSARCIVHVIAVGVTEENYSRMQRYYDGYPDVRFHRIPQALGFYECLVHLLEKYETDYVAFQRSTDIALPNRIADSISFLKSQDVDIAGFGAQNIMLDTEHKNTYTGILIAHSRHTNRLHAKSCAILMRESVVLKKELIQSAQNYPDKYKHKFGLNMYWRMKPRVAIAKRVMLLRRPHLYGILSRETIAKQWDVSECGTNTSGSDKKSGNIILTTYFTNMPDPQTGNAVHPNDHESMKLAKSCMRLGLDCIIFHDRLDEQFCKQYPGITFVKVPNTDMSISCNNLRFYVYLHWLEHRRYTNVWLCDLFDVEVKRNPNTLETRGKIWVGIEDGNTISGAWWREKLFEAYGYTKTPLCLRGKPTLNAGVFGGDYETVVAFLKQYTTEMSYRPAFNSNMPIFNMLMHNKKSRNIVMCIEPLVSRFRKYENRRDDVCFIHK